MKIFLLVMMSFIKPYNSQTSIYDQQVQSITGKAISLAAYQGKKMMIVVSSPDNLVDQKLAFYDSLQKSNPSVVLIIVPMQDFNSSPITDQLSLISNTISTGLLLTSAVQAEKNKGASQNGLLRWLTNASENSHFDADVITDEQYYLVSESGILYAVLQKGVMTETVNLLLKQDDVKN